MKETKVYVDELPESCKKCAYSQINLALGVETRICGLQYGFISIDIDKFPNCPLQSLKTHDRELVKEVCENIIKFINELAWKDVQYDAFQSTIGEFSGSTSAIPRYAKKYFDLWKEMFGEDLENKG